MSSDVESVSEVISNSRALHELNVGVAVGTECSANGALMASKVMFATTDMVCRLLEKCETVDDYRKLREHLRETIRIST